MQNRATPAGAAPAAGRAAGYGGRLVALVTSRTVLRLSGEHGFRVPPPQVPPAGARPDRSGGSATPQSHRLPSGLAPRTPGFEVTGGDAQAVAEICCWLDGLPLAIELAAARAWLLGRQQPVGLPEGVRSNVLAGRRRQPPGLQPSWW